MNADCRAAAGLLSRRCEGFRRCSGSHEARRVRVRVTALRVWREKAVEIIGVLIAGVFIGFLGKLLAGSDKDDSPLWLTTLCGIVGALFGWIIYMAFGGDGSPGLDWTCWIVVVVCAAIPVALAVALVGHNKVNFPH